MVPDRRPASSSAPRPARGAAHHALVPLVLRGFTQRGAANSLSVRARRPRLVPYQGEVSTFGASMNDESPTYIRLFVT